MLGSPEGLSLRLMELLDVLLRAGFRGLCVSPRAAGKPASSVLTCTGTGAGEAVAPGYREVALLLRPRTVRRRSVCETTMGLSLTWKRTEDSGLGGLS